VSGPSHQPLGGPSPQDDSHDPEAAPAASGKVVRDAKVRLLVTPIILGIIAGVLYLQHATGSALGTHLVLAIFGALAGAEMALLFRGSRGEATGDPALAAIGCGLLCAVGLFPMADLGSMMSGRVVVLFLLLLVVLLQHLRDTRPEAVDAIALKLVPFLFVGLAFSFMASFAFDWRLIGLIVLTSKASDMAGWAVGVPFGKHKMIPSVSPGKSWEGTLAGLAASALVATFLPRALGLWPNDYPWIQLPFFGLLLGAASILAGITWSGWKRRLGAKDSSALIPEMGGIMDMVDSLLLAGPAAYVWFRFLA
jgi:phosphatidate cytidylyltransferase